MTKNLVDKEAYQFDILQLLAENLIQIEDEMLYFKHGNQGRELFLLHSELFNSYTELLKQYLNAESEELL